MPDPGLDGGMRRDEVPSSGLDRRRSGRGSRRDRKASRDVKKLEKQHRTYSFSPGRNDSIHVGRDTDRPPVPPLPTDLARLAGRINPGFYQQSSNPRLLGQKPLRATTMPPVASQDWQRAPTLQKRSAQDLPRRKSSKKRKEQHDREAEIKAMVPVMPTRAATDADFGRLVKKDSKRLREGLNRRLQNKSSDISLPTAGSINSSMSLTEADQRGAYWLNAFDVFAPRPTIRYSHNPRYVHGGSGLDGDSSDSRKRRVMDQMEITDEKSAARKRIADLADDLDASELRELMERDQKRREKKEMAEKIRMERKLAKRQEKQKMEEDAAARAGTPPPPNLERGVLGREVVDSSSGTSAVVTSSKRRNSDASLGGRSKHPSSEFHPEESATRSDSPHKNSEPPANMTSDHFVPSTERREQAVEATSVASIPKPNVSATSFQQTHGPLGSGMSHLLDLHKTRQSVPSEKSGSSRRTSENSSRPPRSWTSFFKRHSREKRSSTPLSFSNTIRDQPEILPTPTVAYTPVWQPSHVPKRTMSKFREDLPELPLSPPDSRVQSPEADPVPPIRTDYPERQHHSSIQGEQSMVRYDTPTSGYRSMDAMRQNAETPTSVKRSIDAASPESDMFLTQSLASIDSEGSWLSGRRGGSKRRSIQCAVNTLHDSQSSLQKRYKEYSESIEELGIAEDEYFSRLTPGPEERYKINRRSGASAGDPVPSSDEEEGGSLVSQTNPEHTKWGAVARHPTVVHRGASARSREGILNDYGEGEVSDHERMENSPTDSNWKSSINSEDLEEPLRRATSIDLGKGHVRHISAGSARLLNLKPKTPEGLKRLSSG
ncbi:hypothetical protein B7463_g8077, partial [Scytalidium lignicola]